MSKLGAGDIVRVDFSMIGRCGHGSVTASTHKHNYSIKDLCATPSKLKKAETLLKQLGVFDTQIGKACITGRMQKEAYESLFSTQLENQRFSGHKACSRQFYRHFWPSSESTWQMPVELEKSIDNAYIQRPHIYFHSLGRVIPPYKTFHIRTNDVLQLLDVVEAKQKFSVTGKGIKVAMLDTGFDFSHAYYKNDKVKFNVLKASDTVTSPRLDENGHGTAMMMNLLAIAPDITFMPIKLDRADKASEGASLTEGFIKARALNPDIITMSAGYDLRNEVTQEQLTTLPHSLKSFETEVREAVESGILVIAAAGNGQTAFPAMMPEVLSVGGIFVDQDGKNFASDLASGFKSKIYNRTAPDVCGLVGNKPYGRYIAMPVPTNSALDNSTIPNVKNDSWVLSSGTSAAAPQIAGICALALEKNSALTPHDIIEAIKGSTIAVSDSTKTFNADSNNGVGVRARGRGLVNAVKFLNNV